MLTVGWNIAAIDTSSRTIIPGRETNLVRG